MAVEADDGLPTTTTGSNLRGGAIAALRWVYPAHDLVTRRIRTNDRDLHWRTGFKKFLQYPVTATECVGKYRIFATT